MLWNIIDRRTNKYCTEIDAVFEPAWHDNSIEGATVAPMDNSWSVSQKYNTTIEIAILTAQTKWNSAVTVFLYDKGSKPVG